MGVARYLHTAKVGARRLVEASLDRVRGKHVRTGYSPDIDVLGDTRELCRTLLADERRRFTDRTPTYLDVGGRKGERADLATGFDYFAMDIIPRAKQVVVGDICSCPQIADNSYDVVVSFDVFEHLERPWDAAREAIRITRPGGLLIHRTLFAYRYHPIPIDYWRFTSQGLEYLFVRDGNVETMVKGYDLTKRRVNATGMPMTGNRDVPPIDFWGGFRETWLTLFVGRKR
jgi:SAM-dependent methyltransferase